jgi:hypothetical protein
MYGVQSAVMEFLTRALDGPLDDASGMPLLTWRNHDGKMPWRLPREAFETQGGFDLEPTWNTGRLHQLTAPARFQPLAHLGLPLLTTEAEAEAFKRAAVLIAVAEMAPSDPSDKRMELRNDILHRARFGDLTDAEAEAEAGRLGVGPLAEKPEPAQFDPMKTPHWTYPMVMAWLLWRDPDEPRQWMQDYRQECWVWRPWSGRIAATPDGAKSRAVNGWGLEQLEPACSMTFEIHAISRATSEGLDGAGLVKEKRGELWTRLGEGKLTGFAVPPASAKPVSIPDHEWALLELCQSGGWEDYLRWRHEPLGKAYQGLLFRRDDVLREWPSEELTGAVADAVDATPAIRRASDGEALRRFRGWVGSELRASRWPTPRRCREELARELGRSRDWVRDRMAELPSECRCPSGNYRAQVSGEALPAYLAYLQRA